MLISYFGSDCGGSLLKVGGFPIDQSLFMDTQLGTGDTGLGVCSLVWHINREALLHILPLKLNLVKTPSEMRMHGLGYLGKLQYCKYVFF